MGQQWRQLMKSRQSYIHMVLQAHIDGMFKGPLSTVFQGLHTQYRQFLLVWFLP